MGCSSGFSKCILVLFNTIIVLLSFASVGVGIFVVVSANTFFSLVGKASEQINNNQDVSDEIKRISEQSDIIRATAFVLIGLGAFILLLSILGCIGALKESKCLLVTYATFIGLLAAAKISLIVVGIIERPKVESWTRSSLKQLQDNFFVSVNEFTELEKPTVASTKWPKELKNAVTLLINYMQVALECCGAKTNKDIADSPSWLESDCTWSDESNMTVPVTCCPVHSDKKGLLYDPTNYAKIKEYLKDTECPETGKGVHSKICVEAAIDLINSYLYIAIGAFGGLILVELLLIIFSLCIVCSSKDEKIRRNRY